MITQSALEVPMVHVLIRPQQPLCAAIASCHLRRRRCSTSACESTAPAPSCSTIGTQITHRSRSGHSGTVPLPSFKSMQRLLIFAACPRKFRPRWSSYRIRRLRLLSFVWSRWSRVDSRCTPIAPRRPSRKLSYSTTCRQEPLRVSSCNNSFR